MTVVISLKSEMTNQTAVRFGTPRFICISFILQSFLFQTSVNIFSGFLLQDKTANITNKIQSLLLIKTCSN